MSASETYAKFKMSERTQTNVMNIRLYRQLSYLFCAVTIIRRKYLAQRPLNELVASVVFMKRTLVLRKEIV